MRICERRFGVPLGRLLCATAETIFTAIIRQSGQVHGKCSHSCAIGRETDASFRITSQEILLRRHSIGEQSECSIREK